MIFVRALMNKEADLGCRAMARLLGTSPSAWCKVKNGERGLPARALRAALVTWPELMPALVDEYRQETAP